jgi:hypothetical protein
MAAGPSTVDEMAIYGLATILPELTKNGGCCVILSADAMNLNAK